jgi:hypothetical protein
LLASNGEVFYEICIQGLRKGCTAMWKWLRRVAFAIFVVIALPCIAFTWLLSSSFPPTFALGRGIDHLSEEDQVAYLILVDQMRQNEALEHGKLSIWVGSAGGECAPNPELDQALAKAWAFRNVTRAPADCTSMQRDGLYVARKHDSYSGGYTCGGFCGEGNFYRTAKPFGIVMIIRTGGYIN